MVKRSTALAGLLASTAIATPLSVKRDYNNQTMISSWKDVPVSKDLKYTPCFENYTCSYLQVPLDYDDSSVGTANIAFVKYPSPKQPAMGDILFNPGGPGESGVDFVLGQGLQLLTGLLGDSYNIVGMDPRGVNNSGPNTDCFPDHPAIRDVYDFQTLMVDPRSNVSISDYYEKTGTWGTWCTAVLDEAKYANTAATARDMVQYFEALAESEGKPKEEALVNYYGASYGSTLGTAFATLFPNRVGRFIIDAVTDAEDHFFGNWSQNLLQADESVEAFFQLCADTGSESLCALYKNGSTADSIKQRVDAVLASLEADPLPVLDPNFVQYPTTVTHMDLRGLIMQCMYSPVDRFQPLAAIISGLENKNGSLLALAAGKGLMPLAECDKASAQNSSEYSKLVIACNDNNHRWAVTEESVTELFKYDRQLSTYFGDVWAAAIMPPCRNLDLTPPENQIFQKFEKVKTSTPILFADNKIDPVTSSYKKMSAFFEDSVVLLQEAIGHGLVVTTSNCTSGYVQNYLKTGELPPPDTVCPTDFKPFPPAPANGKRGLTRRGLPGFGGF